jgi:hypothetical protein
MRRWLLALGSLAAGCAREPEDALCPELAAGALVVTEVRGPQTPADAGNGEWIELYNASGGEVDLIGLRVRFRRKDGSSEVAILVRDHLPVAAGGRAVLGLFLDDATRPAHVDYGFAVDFTESWLAAAAIDVESCGRRIDRAIYDLLPKQGTFALSGSGEPSAAANDDPGSWCTDASTAGSVFPGSPRQPNPPCP